MNSQIRSEYFPKSLDIGRKYVILLESLEKAESIIQLISRFRDVPEDEQECIRSEKNLKVLDSWYEDALQYVEDTLQHKEAKVKSDIILKLLDDYEIPEVLKNRILSETSPEVLELWFQAARHAKSLEDFTEKAVL